MSGELLKARFAAVLLLALALLVGTGTATAATEEDASMQGIAQFATERPAEITVTEIPQVASKSVSADAELSDEQIEKQKQLADVSATTDELRAKVRDLEAQIEHLDAVSAEKTRAIEAAKAQLDQ